MPPGNRLAPVSQNAFGAPPTLAEIQLAARTAQRPSPLTLGERAQEINYGLGRGFTNILQGNLGLAQALYQDPRAVGSAFVDAARQFAASPVDTVGNSLRGMWTRAKSSPAGLGEVVGENIDPRNFLKPRKGMRQELDVYHGTPHTFDPETGAPLGRFRSEKIGTGEGAQVYGYGLYFAEDPKVAGTYKRMDSPFSASRLQGVPATVAALAKIDAPGGPDDGARFLRENYDSFAKQWGKQEVDTALKSLESGSLYKVDLPDAKIEQMLDWDKPLKEQPKEVRQALTRLAQNAAQSDEQLMEDFKKLGPSAPANQLYAALVQRAVRLKKYEGMRAGIPEDKAMPSLTYGQQIASEQLRQAGIPGIKYLDAGSRAGEKGTRNFVVFPGEEQHLNILSRD